MAQYQKNVLAAILKQNNFFICYFSDVNVFMFSYFEPNCIEKFPWESFGWSILYMQNPIIAQSYHVNNNIQREISYTSNILKPWLPVVSCRELSNNFQSLD